MELDGKSRYVEMHHTAVLRQMLEFAHKALKLDIQITLNHDYSGIFKTGDALVGSGAFGSIVEAVEILKEIIKQRVAKQIDYHNKQLRETIEKVKEINKNRDNWKTLGEQVLEGKWEIPEVIPATDTKREDRLLQQMQDAAFISK